MHTKDSIVRIVIIALMLYALANLASVKSRLEQTKERAAQLQLQQEQLLEEQSELRQSLEQGLSREHLAAMAREKLGFVMPDEIVFYFTKDRED